MNGVHGAIYVGQLKAGQKGRCRVNPAESKQQTAELVKKILNAAKDAEDIGKWWQEVGAELKREAMEQEIEQRRREAILELIAKLRGDKPEEAA